MAVAILVGDCRTVLRALKDESVHCVVTSPPYWGLRDYGTAKWEGGDPKCGHVEKHSRNDGSRNGVDGFAGNLNLEGHANMGKKQYRDICLKCGARRIDSQLGLESTPQEYVARIVEVFREVRRVLRKDGTVWLNLGDSYANDGKWGGETGGKQSYLDDNNRKRVGREKRVTGLKPKDLVGIPWRVAFALQSDGWYLRQDIIWAKPNPMPESVRDRCTKAHEYMFMLSKSARYFYDAAAIKEPMKDVSLQRLSQPNVLEQPGGPKDPKTGNRSHKKAINNQAARLIKHERWKTRFEGWDEYDKSLGRNKRSVWEVTTQPFSEAHFATFPPALVEPCVLAGCLESGTVLDPFGGAGTVGLVADRLGRNAILIELNPQYAEMAERRIKADNSLFSQVTLLNRVC